MGCPFVHAHVPELCMCMCQKRMREREKGGEGERERGREGFVWVEAGKVDAHLGKS